MLSIVSSFGCKSNTEMNSPVNLSSEISFSSSIYKTDLVGEALTASASRSQSVNDWYPFVDSLVLVYTIDASPAVRIALPKISSATSAELVFEPLYLQVPSGSTFEVLEAGLQVTDTSWSPDWKSDPMYPMAAIVPKKGSSMAKWIDESDALPISAIIENDVQSLALHMVESVGYNRSDFGYVGMGIYLDAGPIVFYYQGAFSGNGTQENGLFSIYDDAQKLIGDKVYEHQFPAPATRVVVESDPNAPSNSIPLYFDYSDPVIYEMKKWNAALSTWVLESEPFTAITGEYFKLEIIQNLDVVYVDGSKPSSGNGLSWLEAKRTIQEGIDLAFQKTVAEGKKYQVWVKSGVYSFTGRDNYLVLRTGLEVYGSFAGNENSLTQRDLTAYTTSMVGDNTLNGPIIKADGLDSETLLDGFSVRGANGNSALDIDNSSLTVSNVVFRNNFTTDRGAAVHISNGYPQFVNCVFENNSARVDGGAVFNDRGFPKFENCTFNSNSTYFNGSAIYVRYDNLEVLNCTFLQNTTVYSGYAGGAIFLSNSSLRLTGTEFKRNNRYAISSSNSANGFIDGGGNCFGTGVDANLPTNVNNLNNVNIGNCP
ncbi:right-handed parallel beta-helix repeat-containing protein [Aureibacter tunicatorum]|uniref:Outer membrane repeat protein n=1 Tax=Aureibacter tunicatorum TaxID=866807 RepID=A0AAE3XT13_9BACT|nr:right-handed parallel beta-helix repeat-containing protein [Aureibacter tunicatorum]MDR6241568.1 putative outer membrane repeat protein [Aureibacter tunicatorum]